MSASMPTPLSAMGEAALRLAARGFAVFPCSGKRPLTRHGCKDATKDPEKIRSLWTQHPDANIGLATGAISGIVGLDIDLEPGGEESLAKLEAANAPLPPTLTARTGGGGRHLLYRYPGAHVGNSAGQLGRGLDVRGDGGYVIAPPSRHPGGGAYAWIDEREPAELPPWLAKLIVAPNAPSTATAPVSKERSDFGTEGGTHYGLAALEQEACAVEATAEGARNDALKHLGRERRKNPLAPERGDADAAIHCVLRNSHARSEAAPFRWTVYGFRSSDMVVVCKRSSRRPPRRARGPRSAGGEGRVGFFEASAFGSRRDCVRRDAAESVSGSISEVSWVGGRGDRGSWGTLESRVSSKRRSKVLGDTFPIDVWLRVVL